METNNAANPIETTLAGDTTSNRAGSTASKQHLPGDISLNPAARAIDSKTFAIGVLSVTAAILLVGMILVTAFPTRALATGQNDRSGDYLMLTQQISNSVEGVVVIDAASKRMNVYGLDLGGKQLKLMQAGFPLDRLLGSQEKREPAKKP